MVRRMRRAGRVIDEKRPVRRDRFLLSQVINRLIRQMLIQGVVCFAPLGYFHFHRRSTIVQRWLPLICLTANESVEVVESLHGGPAVEWAGDAGLPVRDVVILA